MAFNVFVTPTIESAILVKNNIQHFIENNHANFHFFAMNEDQLFIFWISSYGCFYVLRHNVISEDGKKIALNEEVVNQNELAFFIVRNDFAISLRKFQQAKLFA